MTSEEIVRPICLPAKDAAALCAVPVATLKAHGPTPIKLGRHLRWRVTDLVAWVKGTTEPPVDEAIAALANLRRR